MDASTAPSYCIRCGREFSAAGEESLCPACQRVVTAAGSPPAHCSRCGRELEAAEEEPGLCGRCRGPAASGSAGSRGAARSFPLEWHIGDVILDLYEVKDIHKGGGMGLVYRVRHRGWNMDLAVKSPRADYFQTEEQKETFVRECETWSDLGLHPHTVSCYYVRTLGGIPRVFAEYVEGGSLSDWIRSGKLYGGGPRQAQERILDVAIQVAWGLHYAHERSLIHQDVKPANVMLTPEGVAKVTDFGLAKAQGAAGQGAEVLPGASVLVSVGGMTPAYCSPEQAARRPLSRRTDIWSWAVSVLEMFTGDVTWLAGQAAPVVLDEYLRDEGAGRQAPTMPAPVAELLRHCFQENPEARPRDFGAVVARLRQIYEQQAGQRYARPEPRAADLRAGGLNNRALSLLDLGQGAESLASWKQSLDADPQHLESTFNLGYFEWQQARITDEEFIERARRIQATHQDNPSFWHCLGLVHAERMDVDAARTAFATASTLAASKSAASGLRDEIPTIRVLAEASFPSGVRAAAVSDDGRLCATGDTDGDIRLWDARTGEPRSVFRAHAGAVRCVVFSRDSRLLVSGGEDHKVRIWDPETKTVALELLGHQGDVLSVALSPDGKSCASGSADRSARLWSVASGDPLDVLTEFSEAVDGVYFSDDSQLLLTHGKGLKVWEVKTGNLVGGFREEADAVVEMSSDFAARHLGRCLGGQYRIGRVDVTRLGLWMVATKRRITTVPVQVPVGASPAFAVSRDGVHCFAGRKLLRLSAPGRFFDYLVARPAGSEKSASEDRQITSLIQKARGHLDQGRWSQALQVLKKAQTCEGFERSNEIVLLKARCGAGGTRAGLANAWPSRVSEEAARELRAAALSPDGSFYVVAGEELTRKDIESGETRWSGRGAKGTLVMRLSAQMAVFQGVMPLHRSNYVTCLALSSEPALVLSGGTDNVVRLWDSGSGRELKALDGHKDWVLAVALSPDGRHCVSGDRSAGWSFSDQESGNGRVRFWSLETGILWAADHCEQKWSEEMLLQKPYLARKVSTVAFAPDGMSCLSGSEDGTVKVWDASSGACVAVFEGHKESVNAASFLPDGRFVLSGSSDKTLRLWDISRGRCTKVLDGHRGAVTCLCVTADGRFVLSGSSDGGIRVWNLETGTCARELEAQAGPVSAIGISRDGGRGFSSTSKGAIVLWDFDWEWDFPDPTDWDPGARPYLETFLTLHTPPVGPTSPARRGRPVWTDDDVNRLLTDLRHKGYGWLRTEGVRAQLARMAADWRGPAPLRTRPAGGR